MKTVTSKNLRQAWLAVHLYLGLGFGLLLALIGLTGSLLVFYMEIDAWLNPELMIAPTTSKPLSYQALWDALQATEPNRSHAWRLEIPDHPQTAVTARYYKPEETAHHGFAPLLVSLNPYTAEVIHKRFWGQYLMTWLFDLHYTLLLDQTGKIVMAIVGLLLLISLLTGVYLWWPSQKQLRSAFTIKRNSSPQRYIYDVHKTSGVYSAVVVVVVTLTGIALEVPQYVNPVIDYFSSVDKVMPKPVSTVMASSNRLTVDQAVATAQQLFPQARLCWIETPDNETGAFRINLRQAFEPSQRFPKTNVWIDQYNGQILHVSNPYQKTAGTKLITWLHPLHNGEAFGMAGRIAVFISGLVLPLLWVTGLIRWSHKRKSKACKTP